MGVVLGVAIALALGDAWWSTGGARAARWAVGLLAFGALWLLGFLDATYLAGPFHFGRHGGAARVLGVRRRRGRADRRRCACS